MRFDTGKGEKDEEISPAQQERYDRLSVFILLLGSALPIVTYRMYSDTMYKRYRGTDGEYPQLCGGKHRPR